MRIKKRLIILLILLISLIGLLLQQPEPITVFIEHSRFVLLGVVGAIFANATGAGGGVIFVPIFNQLNLASTEIVATSFVIQCFGMVAGSIAWRDHYLTAKIDTPQNQSIWAALPRLLMVTVPFSIIGIWTVQYSPLHNWISSAEDSLHWAFGSFSIFLACAIFASLGRLKAKEQAQKITTFDCIALAIIAYVGGMITAWLSVGVGELVAVYLILRHYSVTLSIAVAVMLSAISVWGGALYYVVSDVVFDTYADAFTGKSMIIYPIACFAGIGAIIGGSVAKYIVLWLNPYQVKVFFAAWVLLMGIVNMPIFS
jgi:uncharacterized membrane protein YfcA